MNDIPSLIAGEFLALLGEAEGNVEEMSDTEVSAVLEKSCARYRYQPSFRQAKRICKRAAVQIRNRRRKAQSGQ